MITPAGAAAKADAPYGYGIARGTLRGVFTLAQAEEALQAARRLAGVGQAR